VTYGLPGTPNTGSGGGGGRGTSPPGFFAPGAGGGPGGSGIVIIRYCAEGVLRVDLLSFTASSTGPGAPVLLEWETAAEVDNAGFNIYLNNNGTPGARLNPFPIPAQGGEEFGSVYSFVDNNPLQAGEVRGYFLEDVEFNGTATLHGPVSVGGVASGESDVPDWSLYN
jgi:hypothetical protein